MKTESFLKLGIDQQRNFVSNRLLSNHFIRQIYPHVCKEIRDQIVRCQKINRKTFEAIPKNNFLWESFCQLQPIILNLDFTREYIDDLDWNAISRRGDLNIAFVREFKDKINWKILNEWNGAWRDCGMFQSKEFVKEFKEYIDSKNI